MSPPTAYPVAAKQDDKVIYETSIDLWELKGEPYDTLQIYYKAARELSNAVIRNEIPPDSFAICNRIEIKHPDGTCAEYTEDQLNKMEDDLAESENYTPTRKSQICVYMAGGFTGRIMGHPVEITLDILSENDFLRVKEIATLLQTPRTRLDYAEGGGDFGYYVKIGDQGTCKEDMKFIFKGGPFSRTPLVVMELGKILRTYVPKLENKQKPNPAQDLRLES